MTIGPVCGKLFQFDGKGGTMPHRIIIQLRDCLPTGFPHEYGENRGNTGQIEIDDVVEIHGTHEQFRELADAANDLAENIESLI